MNETDVTNIMEQLVKYAECTSCNCKECHAPKTPVTTDCFLNHPGWVNISPNQIERVLRNFDIGKEE